MASEQKVSLGRLMMNDSWQELSQRLRAGERPPPLESVPNADDFVRKFCLAANIYVHNDKLFWARMEPFVRRLKREPHENFDFSDEVFIHMVVELCIRNIQLEELRYR